MIRAVAAVVGVGDREPARARGRLGLVGCSGAGGGVTTKPMSPPRSRTSTEPGASWLVISSAAVDRALSRARRSEASSGAGQPFRERARLVAAQLGGRDELPAQLVDVGGEVHDGTVTSP